MNSQMAWWIIDQLVQQGVTDFCIAPGSRSSPLALAAAHHRGARLCVHYDERGLGFYALGIAKASGLAAAVIVTSGTAVGNLMPSVMEAYHSRAPLILLTADRPFELIGAGANQTCEQMGLFGAFARGRVQLPTAGEGVTEEYARSSLAHAVCLTKEDPGPIQVNWHIRDPLFTPPFPSLSEGKEIRFVKSRAAPLEPTKLSGLGVIAIGRLAHNEEAGPILELARKLKWPVFADILSQARLQMTNEQILSFDALLQEGPLEAETLLHFGERLTAKSILSWKGAKRHIHVSPWRELQDPSRSLTERIVANATEFCTSIQGKPAPESWLAAWKEKDGQIQKVIAACLHEENIGTEPHAFSTLGRHFDPNWSLYLGSGMPIRNADHFFFPRSMKGKIFSNRGLSGIDGNIATAAGLAEKLEGPLVAFIGDQAALHDLNSLPLLKKTKHPVLLIISNNFGGGIFSHLPIAKATEHFETLWANAHSWQFENAANMFGLAYEKAESIEKLKECVNAKRKNSSIIEFITSRQEAILFHQKLKEKRQAKVLSM